MGKVRSRAAMAFIPEGWKIFQQDVHIKVHVKGNPKDLHLVIKPTTTVEDLKHEIFNEMHSGFLNLKLDSWGNAAAIDMMILRCHGHDFHEDGRKVSEYGVVEGDKVQCRLSQ